MAMFDYKDFTDVFGNVAPFPDRAFHQETEAFRRSHEGVLFIDRVLKALGIAKCSSQGAFVLLSLVNRILTLPQPRSTPPRRKMPSARCTSTSATPP